MPRQSRRHADSMIYHVMMRGVNRDAIFLEDDDYSRFLSSLESAKDASGCQVLAYCLMSNHVHLVLCAAEEPIGAVVKRLGVRYAGWFNRKYGRVGHLFQDRFLSQPVETDAYLAALLRYVWSNPVKAGLVERAEQYRWSSRRLLGQPSSLLDADALGALFEGGDLAEIARGPETLPVVSKPTRGRPRRYTDAEAADLMRRAAGVDSSDGFRALDGTAQRQAIRELRTRGVSYDQIAMLTGLSVSAVRRRSASSTVRVRDVA